MISVIVPILNEETGLPENLQRLQPLRGRDIEIVVVDGGSTDASLSLAQPLADLVLVAPRGRCYQMNAGARRASGDTLVFLHADTRLPATDAGTWLQRVATTPGWGFFDVRLSGNRWPFRVIETLMNARSRLTGIGTGDQVLYVNRALFDRVGGFPSQPLMEDIELCKRLKAAWGWPGNPAATVVTSSRRWESGGILATVLLMWWLRAAYFLGVSPRALARRYHPG